MRDVGTRRTPDPRRAQVLPEATAGAGDVVLRLAEADRFNTFSRTDVVRGDPRLPVRFWSKVHVDERAGCWLWMASCNGAGFPQYAATHGRPVVAADFAFRALIGAFRGRVDRCSAWRCGNRLCVRPGHFDPVASDMVGAAAVARALSIASERVGEWARDGLIPSYGRGRQRRYRMLEIASAIAALQASRINGVLYRNTARGRSVRIRGGERNAVVHTCAVCQAQRQESDFPPSGVRREIFVCKACRRNRHAVEREQLSDAYVKDQLRKKTGLRADDTPSALVEAHRAHLKVSRLIRDKEKRTE